MILVTMRLDIRPGSRADFLETAKGALKAIESEPGCRSCRAAQDVNDPDSFTIQSEWETQADLDRHLVGDGYATLIAEVDRMCNPQECVFVLVTCTAEKKPSDAERRWQVECVSALSSSRSGDEDELAANQREDFTEPASVCGPMVEGRLASGFHAA